MSTTDSSPRGFPRELLERSIEERLHYFEKVVISHLLLKQTYESLLHAIRHPASTSTILVFGPTGVGKTTLRQQIEKQLIKDALANPNANPGHIPVVGMEAVAPDSGSFNWRKYYIRALMALDEPMLGCKITYEFRGIHRDEQGKLFFERSVTATDMRRVLEKCLLNRRPQAFMVDEAQHFQKMASSERLLDQMDSLKSLASLTKTVDVLIGTYDLLELKVHRRTAWEWAQGTQIPQLDALLRICSYFGTTPIQLFTGDFQEVALALQNSSKKKSTSERPHRLFKRFEAEKLQDVLEQVLQ